MKEENINFEYLFREYYQELFCEPNIVYIEKENKEIIKEEFKNFLKDLLEIKEIEKIYITKKWNPNDIYQKYMVSIYIKTNISFEYKNKLNNKIFEIKRKYKNLRNYNINLVGMKILSDYKIFKVIKNNDKIFFQEIIW